jgi:opacity protein-like surface antigen
MSLLNKIGKSMATLGTLAMLASPAYGFSGGNVEPDKKPKIGASKQVTGPIKEVEEKKYETCQDFEGECKNLKELGTYADSFLELKHDSIKNYDSPEKIEDLKYFTNACPGDRLNVCVLDKEGYDKVKKGYADSVVLKDIVDLVNDDLNDDLNIEKMPDLKIGDIKSPDFKKEKKSDVPAGEEYAKNNFKGVKSCDDVSAYVCQEVESLDNAIKAKDISSKEELDSIVGNGFAIKGLCPGKEYCSPKVEELSTEEATIGGMEYVTFNLKDQFQCDDKSKHSIEDLVEKEQVGSKDGSVVKFNLEDYKDAVDDFCEDLTKKDQKCGEGKTEGYICVGDKEGNWMNALEISEVRKNSPNTKDGKCEGNAKCYNETAFLYAAGKHCDTPQRKDKNEKEYVVNDPVVEFIRKNPDKFKGAIKDDVETFDQRFMTCVDNESYAIAQGLMEQEVDQKLDLTPVESNWFKGRESLKFGVSAGVETDLKGNPDLRLEGELTYSPNKPVFVGIYGSLNPLSKEISSRNYSETIFDSEINRGTLKTEEQMKGSVGLKLGVPFYNGDNFEWNVFVQGGATFTEEETTNQNYTFGVDGTQLTNGKASDKKLNYGYETGAGIEFQIFNPLSVFAGAKYLMKGDFDGKIDHSITGYLGFDFDFLYNKNKEKKNEEN